MDSGFTIPVLLADVSLLRVLTVSCAIIGLSVCLHAWVMHKLYDRLCQSGRFAWIKLTAIVLALLATHTLQIIMFGAAYHFGLGSPSGLSGSYDGSFNDAVYFSAAVYTTVGFGDITPMGYLRLMVSFEALAGLMLIAWSASFTFVAMSKLATRTDPTKNDLSDHTLESAEADAKPRE